MSVNAFLEITPKEFYLALVSKNEHDGMMVESNVKMVCNTLRQQTLYLLNPQLKRPISNPRRLMQFPWDGDKPIGKPQTKEEMKNVMKAIVAHHRNRKGKKE